MNSLPLKMRKRLHMANLALCGIWSIVCAIFLPMRAGGAESGQSETLRWQRQSNESLALVGSKGVIWQFNFGNDISKPFFHPVALPTGEVLTCNRPPDHPWHHALWFSWKTINGVNYWEEDRETGQSGGQTTWSNVEITTQDDGRARIVMLLSYQPRGEQPVLTEKRTLQISAPSDHNRQYHIDWSSKFTAGSTDAILDRTPVPPAPNGKTWGGYAGLSIRFAENMSGRQAFSANGPVEFDENSLHRSNGPAMDYNGLVGERPVGIAILDHPDNPRHPTPWYAIRSKMSYLNSAFLTHKPYLLKGADSFTLRYRLLVHFDRWEAAALRTAWAQYAARPF
jgi:methane monooxygenase PmoA-like